MKEYVEASPRARLMVLLTALLLMVLGYVALQTNEWFPLSGTLAERLSQQSLRTLIAALLTLLLFGSLAVLHVVVGLRTIRARRWPPPGLAMPSRTPIVEIRHPFKVWAIVVPMVALFSAHIVLAGYKWWRERSFIQSVIPLLNDAQQGAPGDGPRPAGSGRP